MAQGLCVRIQIRYAQALEAIHCLLPCYPLTGSAVSRKVFLHRIG